MAHANLANSSPSPPSLASIGILGTSKYHDTPDTRLTVLTPEATSSKTAFQTHETVLGRPSVPADTPAATESGRSSPEYDPFVTRDPRPHPRLSATAAAFTPSVPALIPSRAQDATPRPGTTHLAHLEIAPRQVSAQPSSSIGISRVLCAVPSGRIATIHEVQTFVEQAAHYGASTAGTHHVDSYVGIVYVSFSNIHDACTIRLACSATELGWHFEFVRNDHLRQVAVLLDGQHVAAHQGQSVMIILSHQLPSQASLDIEAAIANFAARYGEVFAVAPIVSHDVSAPRYTVEFSDVRAAGMFIERYGRDTHQGEGFIFRLAPISLGFGMPAELPNSSSGVPSAGEPSGRFQVGPHKSQDEFRIMSRVSQPAFLLRTDQHSQMSRERQMMPLSEMAAMSIDSATPDRRLEPTVRTPSTRAMTCISPLGSQSYATPVSNTHYSMSSPSPSMGQRPGERRQYAMRVARSPAQNANNHHNHVDVLRIREGIDVRTTIMLRNIPNKVDQSMLKRILDESSWAKFDFMYLRIDFANDCNVGYAFINFVDPLDIIDFVNARGNQRWNCFKSDKVAEISYATIQGKDCLVQKFRNSSVMNEPPHCRPKLYYTLNGPSPELAGQEEPFAKPDNPSKMKRSMENAEHVGLFTPTDGQHFRNEQRMRRSQYDRGTRMAALDECGYNSPFPQIQTYY